MTRAAAAVIDLCQGGQVMEWDAGTNVYRTKRTASGVYSESQALDIMHSVVPGLAYSEGAEGA